MHEEPIASDEEIEAALAEEIDSDEVEKVTQALGDIMEQVEGETVYALLQEAYDCISALVEWEEEDDDEAGEAVGEAIAEPVDAAIDGEQAAAA